jgi:uncharacterized membrane protein
MIGILKAVRKVWSAHFLGAEFVLAAVLDAGLWYYSTRCNTALLPSILKDNRAAVYGALASVFGTLLGFAITAVSILLGYVANRRLAPVRASKHWDKLWDTYKSAMRVLATGAAAALVALVADREQSPQAWAMYAALFLVPLSLLRIVRCIWILESVTNLVVQQTP